MAAQTTAVLLDLDGTLLNSIELIMDAYRHTFEVHADGPADDADLVRGIGTPLRQHFAALEVPDQDIATWIATYATYYRTHAPQVRPYAGAVEAVTALGETGVRLAVVTSKRAPGARRSVASMNLQEIIEVVISADEVDNPKPHPEPVQLALQKLGVSPHEAIFVGDSPHDMASGRAAGVRTAAAQWGPFTREALAAHTPDLWLTEPHEIASLPGIAPTSARHDA